MVYGVTSLDVARQDSAQNIAARTINCPFCVFYSNIYKCIKLLEHTYCLRKRTNTRMILHNDKQDITQVIWSIFLQYTQYKWEQERGRRSFGSTLWKRACGMYRNLCLFLYRKWSRWHFATVGIDCEAAAGAFPPSLSLARYLCRFNAHFQRRTTGIL